MILRFAPPSVLLLASVLLLGLLSSVAHAQDTIPRWTVGALGTATTSPFEAEAGSPRQEKEIDITGFPYIAYRGDRFFLDGIGAGMHLLGGPASQSALSLDVLITARTRPGSSRDKIGADAGLRLAYETGLGRLGLAYLHDVSDTSNGSEFIADYSYTVNSGRLSLTPSVSIIRQSASMAQYLWGVTPAEHDRMIERGHTILAVYALPGAVITMQASLSAGYQIQGNWSLLVFTNVTRLDKDIRRNPGVDERYMGSAGFGIAYSF